MEHGKNTIYVDADACPVKTEIEQLAQAAHIPVVMVSSLAHEIPDDGYASVVKVDTDAEAADLAIANLVSADDIVVTQDYGLASMCLGKRARVLSPHGKIFTDANIDRLLEQRHEFKRARRRGDRPKSKNKPFGRQDRDRFIQALKQVLELNAAN